MKKKIILLDRDDFNKRVSTIENEIGKKGIGFGPKGVNALIFYAYTDQYGTLIEFVCNEELTRSGNHLNLVK